MTKINDDFCLAGLKVDLILARLFSKKYVLKLILSRFLTSYSEPCPYCIDSNNLFEKIEPQYKNFRQSRKLLN